MNTTRKIITAAALVACSAAVSAAETQSKPMHDMMREHHGTGAGQHGMMHCPMMGAMGSGGGMGGMMGGMGPMMGGRGMHVLPPGNEKLQLQMQAEIMQKVGEILAKYAAQIQPR